MLDKFDEVSISLRNKSCDKVRVSFPSAYKSTADKSEFGWQTSSWTNTCQTCLHRSMAKKIDWPGCIVHIVRRAARVEKKRRRRQKCPFTRESSQPTASNVFPNSKRSSAGDYAVRKDLNPSRCLGPCLKISLYFYCILLALFLTRLDGVARIPQSNATFDL